MFARNGSGELWAAPPAAEPSYPGEKEATDCKKYPQGKKFKWELRGKRRLHKTPAQREVTACHVWLEQELAQVRPSVVVTLGATALKSVLQDGGATMSAVMDAPFQHDGRWVVAVYHPSFVLRARDEDSRQQAYEVIVAGLREALRLAVA